MGLTRRTAIFLLGAASGIWAGARFGGKVPPIDRARWIGPTGAAGTLNDASLLSETPIASHRVISAHSGDALVDRLRVELAESRETGRAFNIGAARHSMGGHAIPRNGHAVTLANGKIEPDTASGTYRVQAGARWSEVIAMLDPLGFGPTVMQSNSDFGVAATFCVNAHGWPVPHGPMGATVRSLRLMLADGEVVTASREENVDLFRLTMGGYGLTGAIIDMVAEMVPNRRLEPAFRTMVSRDFGPAFAEACETGKVSMAYGRLNVDRRDFFEQALMVTYRESADQSDLPFASGPDLIRQVEARVFRAQLMNEGVKDLRWWLERTLAPRIATGAATRNALINKPVATIGKGDPTRTDILHEYFVPPNRFADFITACQEVIPASYQELMNITLRYVRPDPDSVLVYAPEPRIACVMLFNQEMTVRAETDHVRMTREMIERVLDLGGTYYLPYRPHARLEHLLQGYPDVREFVERKLDLDPRRVFRNGFWDNYLAQLA